MNDGPFTAKPPGMMPDATRYKQTGKSQADISTLNTTYTSRSGIPQLQPLGGKEKRWRRRGSFELPTQLPSYRTGLETRGRRLGARELATSMLTVQGSWQQDCIEPPTKMICESLFVGVHLVYFIRLLVHRPYHQYSTRCHHSIPIMLGEVFGLELSTGIATFLCDGPMYFNTALDMCVELRYLKVSDLLICNSGILHQLHQQHCLSLYRISSSFLTRDSTWAGWMDGLVERVGDWMGRRPGTGTFRSGRPPHSLSCQDRPGLSVGDGSDPR